MPILTIQRRQTEVGRIRIGESVDTGKRNRAGQAIRRPVKLQKFRFTSASKTLIEQVASVYGGQPAQWQPQGSTAPQWEVYTDATALPVVVPPNSVSQWYESWNGGACVRRCDGQRELLQDRPCVCPPDPTDRNPMEDCKPTTRISLMLADVPGIGVWRLETHGFYAATELPAVAELLAAAGGYVVGRLELEQRSARRPKANGPGMETRTWMVPVLHVDSAPRELVAGGVGNGGGAPAVTAVDRPSLESAASNPNQEQVGAQVLTAILVLKAAEACKSLEQVRRLWADALRDGVLTEEVKAALTAKGESFNPPAKPVSAPPAAPAVEGEVEPDAEQVWAQVMSAVPATWTSSELEEKVQAFLGKSSIDANGFELQRFLAAVKSDEVK